MKNSIEDLIFAIEKGKVRGFDEVKEIDGERYLFQYSLKKKNGLYYSYLFYIIEKKLDIIEDYGVEEIKEFSNLTDAFDYFKSLDVGVESFSSIKGTSPW